MAHLAQIDKVKADEILQLASSLIQNASPLEGLSGWTEARLRQELLEVQAFVSYLNGQLDSFILFRILPDSLEISLLATATWARRQGRMQTLFQEFLLGVGEYKEIWLEVHEGNLAARNLYRKLGFQEVGKRPRYYPDGGAAILMTRKAKPLP